MMYRMTLVGIFLALTCVTDFTSAFPEYKRNNKSDLSRILFPTTKKIESQEIPLELIRRLNAMSSVDEFFTNMVQHSEELSDRIGEGGFEKSLIRAGTTGKCMPEYTTVSLKPDQSATTFYYPRCVRVKRCGGCCLHSLFSCRAIEKEFVPVTVAIAEYRGGFQFLLKEKKIIEIEEHKQCECRCKIQPQDCTKYQRYNAENCRCECPNAVKCFKKIWNPEICSCICREEVSCGTGFEFDPFTCSCLTSRGKKNPNFLYQMYL